MRSSANAYVEDVESQDPWEYTLERRQEYYELDVGRVDSFCRDFDILQTKPAAFHLGGSSSDQECTPWQSQASVSRKANVTVSATR